MIRLSSNHDRWSSAILSLTKDYFDGIQIIDLWLFLSRFSQSKFCGRCNVNSSRCQEVLVTTSFEVCWRLTIIAFQVVCFLIFSTKKQHFFTLQQRMSELYREKYNPIMCLCCVWICICSQLTAAFISSNPNNWSTNLPCYYS